MALVLLAWGCVSGQPELEPVSYEQWEKVIASHQGGVVVVNIWAGWCRTCLELFPSMVGMYEVHRPNGVQFLSLCLDDSNDLPAIEKARHFLIEQQANFPHYLLQADIAETFSNLDLEGIPAVLIYDSEGNLRYRFEGDALTNKIIPVDVEDAIESLL